MTLPVTRGRSILSGIEWTRRLFRLQPYGAAVDDEGHLLISWNRRVLWIDLRTGAYRDTGIDGSRILRQGIASDGRSFYFGEYRDNSDRGAISVWRVDSVSGATSIAYRYLAGAVRHVHRVIHVPDRDSFLVLSGDIGEECRIDEFSSSWCLLRSFGDGTERTRAVAAVVLGKRLIYAMDAEYVQNELREIDLETGERRWIADLEGPVFDMIRHSDGICFSTVFEGKPAQRGRYVTVYNYSDDELVAVSKWVKDFASVRFFQFGQLALVPAGGWIYIRPQGVVLRSGAAASGDSTDA